MEKFVPHKRKAADEDSNIEMEDEDISQKKNPKVKGKNI